MTRSTGSRAGLRRSLTAAAACAFIAALLLPASAAMAASPGTQGQPIDVTNLGMTPGTGGLAAPATPGALTAADATTVEVRAAVDEHSPKVPGPGGSGAPGAGLGSPNPAPNAVAGTNPGSWGFNALSHYDTRTVNGGNQFSIEPPDQGLCVGNGFVVEPINDVVGIFDTSGTLVAGPTGIAPFFGYPAEFIRPDGPFGPGLTDPRCIYDAGTNRFFMTASVFDTDRKTGDLKGTTHVDILVSASGDPTGPWDRFSFNTTDDGKHHTPSHPGCPCFADEPLLGADATGIFISSNEFSVFGPEFNGAQVYALDKWALAAGTASTAIHFEPGALAEGIAYSLSPANATGANSSANGGTEYFLSALQFGPSQFDNRIAIWALTNTSSLDSASPSLSLTHAVIKSEVYGQPDPMKQKPGPKGSRPLGELLHEKLQLVNSGDDRMNQVTYQGGNLWSAVDTAIGAKGDRAGIAWFKVTPSWHQGAVGGKVTSQGYVSLAADNVVYPSIAVNNAGKAVMAFSIIGPHYFPSAGYLTLVGASAGTVHVAAAGVGPEDGFSGYPEFFGETVARWGDYTNAVVDGAGHIWIGAEYIPGGPRTDLANWGTFISEITP
jgi:hypothetical protein